MSISNETRDAFFKSLYGTMLIEGKITYFLNALNRKEKAWFAMDEDGSWGWTIHKPVLSSSYSGMLGFWRSEQGSLLISPASVHFFDMFAMALPRVEDWKKSRFSLKEARYYLRDVL